jgi:hypothetical protein
MLIVEDATDSLSPPSAAIIAELESILGGARLPLSGEGSPPELEHTCAAESGVEGILVITGFNGLSMPSYTDTDTDTDTSPDTESSADTE